MASTKITSRKKQNQKPSNGLGDKIEKITEATGIKKAVKFLFGEDCNCDKRKERLNKMFPNKDPLCLQEKEHEFWTEYLKNTSRIMSNKEATILTNIWNRVFQTTVRYEPCRGCGSKPWQDMIDNINQIYRTYEIS